MATRLVQVVLRPLVSSYFKMPTCADTCKPTDELANLPLVSIIVNNFNYARFLRQSMVSALDQSYSRTEVIVVDDASNDDSANIIRSYGDRVIAVLRAKNGGQAAALNAGFAASSGKIVIFLDSDDYLYPNAVAQVATAFEPGVAIVQYRLHLADADGNIIDLYPPSEVEFDTGNVVKKLLATGRYEGNVTSGNAFSRNALSEVFPIPEDRFRIGADGYLVTVAPFYGTIGAIELPLGAYRRHNLTFGLHGSGALSLRCQRSIQHDAEKHRALAEFARVNGFEANPEPGLRDWQHVQSRIGSLLLDPTNHPVFSDTRIGLSWRGASAAWQARIRLKRRVIVTTWFLALGFSPSFIAKPLFAWYSEPSTRPQFARRVLKVLRKVSR